MRTVVVAIQNEGSEAVRRAEAHHALALGHALGELNLNPWILCNPASPLSRLPIPIPRFCIDPDRFWDFFRLWQWQRADPAMLVLALGEQSGRLARRLCKMGPKSQRIMGNIFLLSPPRKEALPLLANSRACICGSSFIAKDLEESKLAAQIFTTTPGMDVGAYTIASPWQEGQRFVFGMDASLLPQSGALLVVRAMAALWQHDDLPPWEVRMFGGGPRFEEIMEEAEKLGVLPRLAILGDQPATEVAGLCHVWISPGTSDSELPWVLWAGFAARIPVICMRTPLHKERLHNSNAVFSIDSDNPQEMARAMLNTMRDATLREELILAGLPLLPQIDLPALGRRLAAIAAEIGRPLCGVPIPATPHAP